MTEAEPAVEQDLSPPDDGRADKLVTTGPPAAQAGGILTVDLAAIEANWRTLGRRAMPTECAAVIKADGYGCGIEQVAATLAKAGCKTFFVADLAEARRVRARRAASRRSMCSTACCRRPPHAYADIRARPVIGSMVELAEWDAFVSANQWRGGAALHVDTGMNRLGISLSDAAALAPRIRSENHGIMLLMSHLACSEEPDHPLNERQIGAFREVRMLYRGIPSSLANSSGIFLGASSPLRHGAPGRRALRRQPDAGTEQSDAPGDRIAGAHRANAHRAARRDRRL